MNYLNNDLTIFFFLQCFEIPIGLQKALLETHDLCMAETGADIANLQKCTDNHIPDESTSKCYLECMQRLIEVNIKEKLATVQDVSHYLNEDIMAMAVEMKGNCDHLEHTDKCDEAWLKANCYLKAHADTQHFCQLLMFN